MKNTELSNKSLNINNSIYVTQPNLPPLDEFIPYLQKIWDNKILTNNGPFHQQFEQALGQYLGVKYISLLSNATIALIVALKALNITGEVITTPYSFVATAHSLLWNGITPVFVDIDCKTFNIDASKIKSAITKNTTAILPVHVYGNPCDVEAIQKIATKYNLKVIYDAAHAFAVSNDTGSILNNGDLSVLSFHATKVFNTFEGGAIISPSSELKYKIDQLKNFGFMDEITVVASGINGKMSEFNAALGLLQLKYIDQAIAQRKAIYENYFQNLSCVKGITCLQYSNKIINNYGYFPILVESDYLMNRDALYNKLMASNIIVRRYFYPLISDFPMYKDLSSAQRNNLPVAANIADKVLCLPIYPELTKIDQLRVIELISGV